MVLSQAGTSGDRGGPLPPPPPDEGLEGGGAGRERERERIIAINTELKNWQELTVFYYKGNANHQ